MPVWNNIGKGPGSPCRIDGFGPLYVFPHNRPKHLQTFHDAFRLVAAAHVLRRRLGRRRGVAHGDAIAAALQHPDVVVRISERHHLGGGDPATAHRPFARPVILVCPFSMMCMAKPVASISRSHPAKGLLHLDQVRSRVRPTSVVLQWSVKRRLVSGIALSQVHRTPSSEDHPM